MQKFLKHGVLSDLSIIAQSARARAEGLTAEGLLAEQQECSQLLGTLHNQLFSSLQVAADVACCYALDPMNGLHLLCTSYRRECVCGSQLHRCRRMARSASRCGLDSGVHIGALALRSHFHQQPWLIHPWLIHPWLLWLGWFVTAGDQGSSRQDGVGLRPVAGPVRWGAFAPNRWRGAPGARC